MERRLWQALVTAVALALPLLSGCGGTEPSAPTTVAPSATSTSTSTSASTPTPTADPSDEKETVETVSEQFVDTALTLEYDSGLGASYAARVKPLMTQRGYAELSSALSGGAKQARAEFGKNARSKPKILSGTKVRTLLADKATTTVEFKPRVQQRKDGRWKTIKSAVVDETAKLTLVKDGDRWLVDKFE